MSLAGPSATVVALVALDRTWLAACQLAAHLLDQRCVITSFMLKALRFSIFFFLYLESVAIVCRTLEHLSASLL